MRFRYKILERRDVNSLARETEAYLNSGWERAGPFVIDAGKFYQPVIKEVDDAQPVDSDGSYDRAMKGL